MKPVPCLTLASLLLAATLTFACKNDNFGKTPSSSNKSVEPSEVPPASLPPKEIIPRVEYPSEPGDYTNFEVGEEASIATDITGTYLTIPKGIKEAGKAIALRAQEKVTDAMVQAVKIHIPKNDLPHENMVVLYRMTSEKNESFYGLIPKKNLVIKENSVVFQPKGLGVYQAAVLPVFVGDERQVPVLTSNGPRLKLVSTYDTPGTASDIFVDGTTAYVADGTGVEVLNLAATGTLTASARVAGTGFINSILGAGGRIYVAAGLAGLGIMDPATALTLQMVDARGNTNGLAVAQNLNNIYLSQESTAAGNSRAGLSRFDIQEISPTYELTNGMDTELPPQNAYGVQIEGTVAYGISRSRLYGLDITQNDRFGKLSQVNLDGSAERLLLHSSRLYVAERNSGITAVDALTPTALKVLGRLALPQVLDLAASGKYLFAVDAARKASLIDISDPSHPLVLNEYTLSAAPIRVRAFGNFIFVTMGEAGLTVLAIESPATP